MLGKLHLKRNITQIFAVMTKEIKLNLRFEYEFLLRFIKPFVSIIIPFIVFTKVFNISETYFFDYYTAENFLLFLLIAYCINYMFSLLTLYRNMFHQEKIWLTLKGLIIAPFNKFNLVVGMMLAEIVVIVPIVACFLIVCYIFFPIPLLNILIFCVIFLAIIVIFTGIGVFIGVLEIVREGKSAIVAYGTQFISWLSCVTYPLRLFPRILQNLIMLNPFYYIFDLLRLSWWAGINPADALQYIYVEHIVITILTTISIPIVSLYLFDIIYKKYGISGY